MIDIRPFQYGASDLAVIDELDKEFFAEDSYDAYGLRQMLDLFSDLVFIAERDGEPLGYVLGGISAQDPPRGWVLSLVVLERDLFVARALTERLIQVFSKKNISGLWLTADPGSDFINSFCRELDFRVVEKLDSYFEPNEPRYLMKKVIGK